MIYVHHHLGLGDHIVCNAIIRNLYEIHGSIILAVRKNNYGSVRQLYKDIDLNFHQVDSDEDCYFYYHKFPGIKKILSKFFYKLPAAGRLFYVSYYKFSFLEKRLSPFYHKLPAVRIGFEYCSSDWEESLYNQMLMNYSKRFSDFYIERDRKREEKLEKNLNLPNRFAFCNVLTSSGVNDLKIKTDLPKVFLDAKTDSLFDWMGVLEKAEEIHTVDSSVFQLIKQLNLDCGKFFYDTRNFDSSRTKPSFHGSDWKIVE